MILYIRLLGAALGGLLGVVLAISPWPPANRGLFEDAPNAGVLIAIIGIAMFGISGLFSGDWERRQVDKYLQQHGGEKNGGETPG